MAAYFYYATSQKPTAVTHAITCAFTGPNDISLILGKTNRLEVYKVTPDGLLPVYDVAMHGRIATMRSMRVGADKKDSIVITTERYQLMVLSYDAGAKAIRTVAAGDLRDRVGRKTQRGQLSMLDPSGKAVVLHFYDGLLKVVPCDRGFREAAFNVRIDEQDVLDASFVLHRASSPTIAMLCRDQAEAVHLRTVVLSIADHTASEGPWSANFLKGEPTALLPVPSPHGGVLVLGRRAISYHAGKGGKDAVPVTTQIPPMSVRCHCMIDAKRYLVADNAGGLYLVVLSTDDDDATGSAASSSSAAAAGGSSSRSSSSASADVTGIEFSRLGETVLASALQYLDAGVVFVGSNCGDPQVIRLRQTKDEATNNYFDVLATHSNVGPIIDFAVVDLERQGQGAVVTCSGRGKEGSLRVVRNGVGIAEQAVVDLPGIRGLWPLRPSTEGAFDKYLVQSYSSETRVFVIEGDAMDDVELAGIRGDVPTLLCATTAGDTLLQVIATQARLISGAADTVLSTWSPPGGARITVAAANTTQVLLALSGGSLVLLEVDGETKKLVEKTTKKMPHEVSCISIHPLDIEASAEGDMLEGETGPGASSSSSAAAAGGSLLSSSSSSSTTSATLAAVGLWTDVTIRMLSLPDLIQVAEEALGGDIPPRSVLLASLENHAHLFVGLGDGHLFTFRVDPTTRSLTERKKVQLGRQPIALTPFKSRGMLHVFAACDRPTVLFSLSRKIVFSNVNLGEVTVMSSFHSEAFPDCLALAAPSTLSIGAVDEIQKLHVKTVALGEQPRRIAHFKPGKVLVVATEGMRGGPAAASSSSSSAAAGDGVAAAGYAANAVETGALLLIDDTTYEPLPDSTFELDPHEMCMSMAEVTLGSTSRVIVVGTAYVVEDEEEPSRGRVLVLAITGAEAARRVHLVAQRDVKGGVFAVAGLAGTKVVAAINSKVQVYGFGAPGDAAAKKGRSSTSASAAAGAAIDEDVVAGSASSSSSSSVPVGVLIPECGYHGHTLALHLDTRGDFILVGDLMKSMSLLRYSAATSTLEEVGAEPSSMWMTAVAMFDDATFVGGERFFNLFTAVRNVTAMEEEERMRLDITGEFHTGEWINRLRPGSLVMLPQDAEDGASGGAVAAGSASLASSSSAGGAIEVADEDLGIGSAALSSSASATKRVRMQGAAAGASSSASASASASSLSVSGPRPRLIFGTVSGAIGVLISLPAPLYKYLVRVQSCINGVVHGVGGLSHSSYRAFYRERTLRSLFPGAPEPAPKGYIDGDLLETFLDMEKATQERVVAAMNGTLAGGAAAASSAAAGGGGGGGAAPVPLFADTTAIKHPDGSTQGQATLEELMKVVEDLSRLH